MRISDWSSDVCSSDLLPKALATLVGFFAYETIGLVERVPRAPGAGLGLPDMIFVRPTTILVFDRLADELFLIAPIWPDANGAIARLIDSAQHHLDSTAARPSPARPHAQRALPDRSDDHTSQLQSLMRITSLSLY